MNALKRFGFTALFLLIFMSAGCATSPHGYLFYGSAINAPVDRIEPGMVVEFTLKPDYRPTTRTVFQTYGSEGFVSTLGEIVLYKDLATMQFSYPSKRSERALENTKMIIAVPFLLPCLAAGACPMR